LKYTTSGHSIQLSTLVSLKEYEELSFSHSTGGHHPFQGTRCYSFTNAICH